MLWIFPSFIKITAGRISSPHKTLWLRTALTVDPGSMSAISYVAYMSVSLFWQQQLSLFQCTSLIDLYVDVSRKLKVLWPVLVPITETFSRLLINCVVGLGLFLCDGCGLLGCIIFYHHVFICSILAKKRVPLRWYQASGPHQSFFSWINYSEYCSTELRQEQEGLGRRKRHKKRKAATRDCSNWHCV